VARLTAQIYSPSRLEAIAAAVAALPDGGSMDRLMTVLTTDRARA
jgi:hypothetical protein